MDNIDKLTAEEKEELGIKKYAKLHLSTFYGKMLMPKLGVCYKCGNTNGPWIAHQNGWLCEDCEVEDNGNKSESRQ